MGRIFKYLGGKEAAKSLWENREALDKYLAILKELMDADNICRSCGKKLDEQAIKETHLCTACFTSNA